MDSLLIRCAGIIQTIEYAFQENSDPFVETAEFEKSPIKTLINDGVLYFFLHSGYEEQKEGFVSLILDGSHGLLSDGDGRSRAFVIKDYLGQERRCELRKTEDAYGQLGMELVELTGSSFLSSLVKKTENTAATEPFKLISTVDAIHVGSLTESIQEATRKVRQKFVFGNCTDDDAFVHMLAKDKLFQLRVAYQIFVNLNDHDHSLLIGALQYLVDHDCSERDEIDDAGDVAQVAGYLTHATDDKTRNIVELITKHVIYNAEFFSKQFVEAIVMRLTNDLHPFTYGFANALTEKIIRDTSTFTKSSFTRKATQLAAGYVFANQTSCSEDSVKFAVTYIINNFGFFTEQQIGLAAGYVIRNFNSFSRQCLKYVAEYLVRKVNPVTQEFIEPTVTIIVHNPQFFSKNTFDLAVRYVIQHVSVVRREFIEASLRGQLVGQPKFRESDAIVSVVERIMNSPRCYGDAAVELAMAYMMRSADSFQKALVEKTIKYVMGNTSRFTANSAALAACQLISNKSQYDAQLVQGGALFIVESAQHFTKDFVMLGVDVLDSVLYQPNQTIIKMACVIINKNSSFFKTPISDSIDKKSQFALFYKNQEKESVVQEYSDGLVNTLNASTDRMEIFWNDKDSTNPTSVRQFFLLKQGEKLNIEDVKNKKRNPFFKEEKEKKSDSPDRQLISIYSLWIQGDFEAALYADRLIAQYIIKNRNHPAIVLWNKQYENNSLL